MSRPFQILTEEPTKSQLGIIAREVGRNLNSMNGLELVELRREMAIVRDKPNTSDFVKGFVEAIIQLSNGYLVNSENEEYRKSVDMLTEGSCEAGKTLFQMNLQRGGIYYAPFKKHAKNCKSCRLVLQRLRKEQSSI